MHSIIGKALLILVSVIISYHYYVAHILKGNNPIELLIGIILAWLVTILFLVNWLSIDDD